MSVDSLHIDKPRGCDGRAPDPMKVGGWSPMRMFRDDEPVDFVIVGTGAGGGTLACRLAEHGFSVVALDAGAWWHRSRSSPPMNRTSASCSGPTIGSATVRTR